MKSIISCNAKGKTIGVASVEIILELCWVITTYCCEHPNKPSIHRWAGISRKTLGLPRSSSLYFRGRGWKGNGQKQDDIIRGEQTVLRVD